jgi:hypothetical protein
MSYLKLTNYESASDTFTFPYNPNTLEIVSTKFIDQRQLPYAFTFMGFGNPIRSSITIALNGHFDGTDKNTNYRALARKVNMPTLEKLYFIDDYSKFYLCTGNTVQKVPSGNRPLLVDYVANFFSPFGILFSDTQQSGLKASTTVKNNGNVATPIEKITGTVTSGSLVTIKDKNNNGFKFTPSEDGTMTYYIVKITSPDNAINITQYMYVEVDGAAQVLQNASTSGDMMLRLEPGESLNDIFAAGSVTGITATFFVRDGWSSD